MRFASLPALALLASFCFAQDKPPVGQNDSAPVENTEVLAKWTFDAKEPGTWKGKAVIEPQGPQPPEFTGFPIGNKAARFNGSNQLVLKESDGVGGAGEKLRFKNGDTISLEAWVLLESIKNNENHYIVGKGRNRNAAYAAENQNWALRLRGEKGEAKLSFLFRTAESKDAKADFHRWTSEAGIGVADGWHLVAVKYTFGKPDSIIGYVDGKPTDGAWDMGGKTTRPPVSDGDDVVVGSGNGGGVSNSLHGWLDNVVVHRGALSEDLMGRRFSFVPPPPAVDAAKLPKGKILVELCEKGVPESNTWPTKPPAVTESYEEEAFGFFEFPCKYIETGIRADRPNPFLFRASAVVALPPGEHRLMVRGRGACHVYVDNKLLLSTPFMSSDDSGHQHAPKDYLDLGPDFHFAPPGNREAWCFLESKGGPTLVSLETLVGNAVGKKKRRCELGETVVAISLAGSDKWELLSPGGRRVPFTDDGMKAYEADREQRMDAMNAEHRAAKRAEQAAKWNTRREEAKAWLQMQPAVAVPSGTEANPIDRFLAAKIAEVRKQASPAADGVSFHRQILPILETKCFSCHSGSKVKGGLNLDSREAVLKGGESGEKAVVPGKPDISEILKRVTSKEEEAVMPPKGDKLNAKEIDLIRKWIAEGAVWPSVHAERLDPTPIADDMTFLRRLALDTVGVTPTQDEIEVFRKDLSPDKRRNAVERYLADPRWADHQMGYWLDVLAENPNILNPTLNNTGPFRWWLYEAFRDNKPFDMFVTELVTLKGSTRFGGPAGFGVASQNDAPMAAKGTILSAAFLGVEMKCARCHDAPFHESKQEQLFNLAALLETKPVNVPATSSVPLDKFHGGRKPLIQVTLKPGTKVEPAWPFPQFVDAKEVNTEGTPREKLAALLTAPQNERFAQVVANRIWKRFMGRGIVEPVDDWEKGKPTHPELLMWLGREFTANGYDQKALQRMILNSQAYQRAVDPAATVPNPLYAAPMKRRLAAEQIVDSLFHAAGKPINTEEVSLDIDGMRDLNNSISLGKVRRSWNLTSTSNERDRPSLALPRVQAVVDVLEAFGWRASRQDPLSTRDHAVNALQPAILSNGVMGVWLTRLSDDHGVTALALKDQSADDLVKTLYLRFLTREPKPDEMERALKIVGPGYESRKVAEPPAATGKRERAKYVSWSNHLTPEATEIKMELEIAARRGDPPTRKLDSDWRERLEDLVWSLANSPEMVYAP